MTLKKLAGIFVLVGMAIGLIAVMSVAMGVVLAVGMLAFCIAVTALLVWAMKAVIED